MTRINLVDPTLLTDQHLMAEWREAKMVPPALLRSLKSRGLRDVLKRVSKEFTLNTGHVMFFYPRMKFLKERYELLTLELIDRGFNLNNLDPFDVFMEGVPEECCVMDWTPNDREILTSVERIQTRIMAKPLWYKYKHESVPKNLYSAFGYTLDY